MTTEQRQEIARRFDLTGISSEHRALKGADKMVYTITAILVAWQAGELSEGQAAQLMNCDRIHLRQLLNELNERAAQEWALYREENPPEIP